VQAQRERLLDQRVRALEVLARVWASKGDHGQAARDAQAAVDLDPYRETAYQLLMRAHAAAGNAARAVAVYHACRRVLAADLGVAPSPATEAAYRAVLTVDPAGGQLAPH
jgi:DNA-binding SARP family transcriptional activator